MIHSTQSFCHRYELDQEIWPEMQQQLRSRKTITMEDIQSHSLVVSISALNFAIIKGIDELAQLLIPLAGVEQLNRTTQREIFTSLHVAVIMENIALVRQLLAAGVNPDKQDRCGWSPLHHAALSCNASIVDVLLSYRADPHLQTNTGGTYKHIANLIDHNPVNPDSSISLFFSKTQPKEGDINSFTLYETQLNQREFTHLTSAQFISENRMSRELMLDVRMRPAPYQDMYLKLSAECKMQYQALSPNFPVHLLAKVTHDSQNKPLPVSPGLGLFARQRFEPLQIIGEYRGDVTKKPIENAYMLTERNALEFRNDMAHVNDGFINTVMISIPDTEGMQRRSLLVATERIEPGAQFCWNYGLINVKISPYVELRGRELRNFMVRESVAGLMRSWQLAQSDRPERNQPVSFEDLVRGEKLRYILSTPSVLFTMIVEGTLAVEKARQIKEIALKTVLAAPHIPQYIKSTVDVAIDCHQMKQKLITFIPTTGALYAKFFEKRSVEVRLFKLINEARAANTFFSQKLDSIKDECDFSQPADQIDAYFTEQWNTKILSQLEKLCRE